MTSIYDHLGISPIINAAGTYTIIGGSRMSEMTMNKIAEAASQHVEIRELQRAVHERIAEMTKNEAAFVCNGAASGLYLCTGAAIAKKKGKSAYYLERNEISDSEIIVFAAHRNPYGQVISQYGATVKEIGYPNIILPLTEKDLEMAINEKTAAIFFFAGDDGGWVAKGGLDFKSTAKVANEKRIPLIVDCAAQIPPISTLWDYTLNGADAVIVSGGKDLKGPQASGLVLGKENFVSHVTDTGFPNYGYGRMLKTGREEIVGMYWALKEAIENDEGKRNEWAEEQIKILTNELAKTELFTVVRTYPNEAGQPMPRASVSFPSDITSSRVLELLMTDDPKVMCNSEHPNQVFVNPMTLKNDEIFIVIEKFKYIEELIKREKK